jgi:hypothetical protein
MKTLGEEIFEVFRSLSAERQSEMIQKIHELFGNTTDEPSRKFYTKLTEVLEKEKQKNV